MGTQPKQSGSAKAALTYITIGSLMDVWTAVYYIYLTQHSPTDAARYWCMGFFLTGIVLIVIGLGIGRIGRSAIAADVAPTPDITVAPTKAASTPTAPPVVAVPTPPSSMVSTTNVA